MAFTPSGPCRGNHASKSVYFIWAAHSPLFTTKMPDTETRQNLVTGKNVSQPAVTYASKTSWAHPNHLSQAGLPYLSSYHSSRFDQHFASSIHYLWSSNSLHKNITVPQTLSAHSFNTRNAPLPDYCQELKEILWLISFVVCVNIYIVEIGMTITC